MVECLFWYMSGVGVFCVGMFDVVVLKMGNIFVVLFCN